MGDASDMNDCDRFMRSADGQAHLNEIVAMLKGRTITDVTFSNEVHCIATTLHLDDGETFVVFQPSLEVDVLREEFTEVIDEEYYKDYPERRAQESSAEVKCAACRGQGYLLMLNTDAATVELQRCDACGCFSSDEAARRYVATRQPLLIALLREHCRTLLASAERAAEGPVDELRPALRTIRASLQHALELLPQCGALPGEDPVVVGSNPKKTYVVGVREVHVRQYEVGARDPEEAKMLVAERGPDVVDIEAQEYSHELEPDTWSVEERS